MFNVTRTKASPLSLQAKKKYDGEDVYKALEIIFFNKCYLCETKEPHDINIEHFDAHRGDENKKFDWNNLYFVCSRCNNIKGATYNNLIDCCDCNQDVFKLIKHLPPSTPYAKTLQIVAMSNNNKALETKELLEKIFNSEHTINKRVSGSFLRRKIFERYNLLLDEISNYYSPTATQEIRDIAISGIKVLMSEDAPYSAFIRWCIFEDSELKKLLFD